MSNFSAGHRISLTTKPAATQSSVTPYDPKLKYNRVIAGNQQKPDTHIYSIDAIKFLRVLNSEDFSDLHKITLACRPVQRGTGVWETLLNSSNSSSQHRSYNACVLVAQQDFSPIPKNRIVTQSMFLDLNRSTSRLYLNELVAGDVVGIGISDNARRVRYILLYRTEDPCVVRLTNETDTDNKTSVLVEAVNVTLEHAIRIGDGDDGSADEIPMSDKVYDAERAGPFVGSIADTLYDITHGYAWKPHFQPYENVNFNREEIEAQLEQTIAEAIPTSFIEVEDMCRALYAEAKKNLPTFNKTPDATKGRQNNALRDHQISYLPFAGVISVGNTFYIKLNEKTYTFTKEDMGNQSASEIHLTNSDLEGRLVKERLEILTLPTLGERAYLRYFRFSF